MPSYNARMTTRERLKLLAVTGLGSGLLPGAPGTWGSAVAAGLWALAAYGLSGFGLWLTGVTLAGIVFAGVLCVWFSPWAIRRAGRGDPQFVVIDELAGQWVALLGWPLIFASFRHDPRMMVAYGILQLLLFRLFDILKPFPCRRLERLPGGWGILADDLMAGVYAGVVGGGLMCVGPCILLTWGMRDF